MLKILVGLGGKFLAVVNSFASFRRFHDFWSAKIQAWFEKIAAVRSLHTFWKF